MSRSLFELQQIMEDTSKNPRSRTRDIGTLVNDVEKWKQNTTALRKVAMRLSSDKTIRVGGLTLALHIAHLLPGDQHSS